MTMTRRDFEARRQEAYDLIVEYFPIEEDLREVDNQDEAAEVLASEMVIDLDDAYDYVVGFLESVDDGWGDDDER